MNDEQLIDDFFNEINDHEKGNSLKSKLGVIKQVKNPNFHKNELETPEYLMHFTPKAEFIAYLEYKEKFIQAQNLLNKAQELVKKNDSRAIHEMSISGSMYKTMIQSALNSWIALGYKNEIEAIISGVAK
jgi:hypothetical protein